jgi:hypothetical protein
MTAPESTAFAIALTIPDNEAFTACETLRRIGLPVAAVRRADIWVFDAPPGAAAGVRETIASIETIFNPNKHALDERPDARPLPGEVWIAPRDDVAHAGVGGRAIPGVIAVVRRVAWQLLDADGALVEPSVLDRAIETFLCNPAFQKAIR